MDGGGTDSPRGLRLGPAQLAGEVVHVCADPGRPVGRLDDVLDRLPQLGHPGPRLDLVDQEPERAIVGGVVEVDLAPGRGTGLALVLVEHDPEGLDPAVLDGVVAADYERVAGCDRRLP